MIVPQVTIKKTRSIEGVLNAFRRGRSAEKRWPIGSAGPLHDTEFRIRSIFFTQFRAQRVSKVWNAGTYIK